MIQSHVNSLNIPINRKTVISAVLSVACFLSASLVLAQSIDAECQCRAPDGQMRNLGTIECIDILGHKKLVRCEMSTNTPYWNDVDGIEGCPAA